MAHDKSLRGQRVALINCTDPHTRLEPGVQGTVTFVDDLGTVFVDWDDGHRLGLVPGEDSWRALHPGRECSPDCAEFGCASWTGNDDYPETDDYGRRFRWVANYSAGVHERKYAPGQEGGSE